MCHLPRGEMGGGGGGRQKKAGKNCCCQNCLCFPFFSLPSGFFPCAHYKVTFLAIPRKWVPPSQSWCLPALLDPPKREGPSVSHAWSFHRAPECQALLDGAPSRKPLAFGWDHVKCRCWWASAAGSLLLPFSRAFAFIFIKPDSKALISHVHLKWKMEKS